MKISRAHSSEHILTFSVKVKEKERFADVHILKYDDGRAYIMKIKVDNNLEIPSTAIVVLLQLFREIESVIADEETLQVSLSSPLNL